MKQCNGGEESGLFSVIDLYGRVLDQQHLKPGPNALTVNLENFATGIYFYETIINNVAISRNRFIIMPPILRTGFFQS